MTTTPDFTTHPAIRPPTSGGPTSSTARMRGNQGNSNPASEPPAGLIRLRDEPTWIKVTFGAILVITAGLYLWNLGALDWANSYYSGAVQAMSSDWLAFLFGSSDMGNSITVDKPPASLWVMALSVRLFGLNTWAIIVPQALMGVGSVAVLFAAVRRWFGGTAALIAAATLALTPVAALMFRYNNPDALLVLLMLLAAYAVVRATEKASWRWLALAGAFIGFAFLTKSLQAFLVLPAMVGVYALAAPTTIGARIKHLIGAAVTMTVALVWWVALAELWPADSRPYIGGSENNSVLNLIFGYNGFGRITGNEPGAVTPGGSSPWGETGWHRLLDPSWAGGIAWLLPTAFVLLAVGLWVTRRGPRMDLARAGLVLWGGWLVVTWATFSFGSGVIHEYYAIALAPAIAAVVAIGLTLLWQRRAELAARIGLGVVVAASAIYAAYLLSTAGSPYNGLAVLVVVLGVGAATVLAVPSVAAVWQRTAAGVAVTALLLGPAAFTVETVATPQTGSLVTAGPQLQGAQVRGPGAGGPMGVGGPMGADGPGTTPPNAAFGPPPNQAGTAPRNAPGLGSPSTGGSGGPGGQAGGGLLNAPEVSEALVAALTEDAAQYTWVAATTGAQTGAGYQLATSEAVMPIGGFNGTDDSPTLEQFQQLVADGEIHYYIVGNGGPGGAAGGPGAGAGPAGAGGPGQSGSSSEISTWVLQTFPATTVDGVTLYDLSA